jgi:hypothetical protein
MISANTYPGSRTLAAAFRQNSLQRVNTRNDAEVLSIASYRLGYRAVLTGKDGT